MNFSMGKETILINIIIISHLQSMKSKKTVPFSDPGS